MTEENKTLSLFQKIHAVMMDIEYLKKDDHVKFGQTNYKAISEEKVTMSVRNALIKHRLIIVPVKQEHSREGNLSTVNTTYRIIDIDTNESIEAVSSGTGADTQDKGVGKAMTYAYKYLFLRTFAIPTGDDPDKVSSAELDASDKKKEAAPITSEQVGILKKKVLEFAGMAKQTEEKVYEVLKIKDVTKLNYVQADAAIEQLVIWVNNRKKG